MQPDLPLDAGQTRSKNYERHNTFRSPSYKPQLAFLTMLALRFQHLLTATDLSLSPDHPFQQHDRI